MIFALDPLFLGDAGTLEVVLIVILKVLVAFSVLLTIRHVLNHLVQMHLPVARLSSTPHLQPLMPQTG